MKRAVSLVVRTSRLSLPRLAVAPASSRFIRGFASEKLDVFPTSPKKLKEGDKVPKTSWKVIENGKWKDVTSDELFKGKVIVFSLPGAFTPTCSTSHLPRYNELWPLFKKEGVNRILCVSVNDTFVMNSWAKDQDSENIIMVPDGNGDFTEGMGQLVDKKGVGFGPRSWRYSMLVEDGKISKLFEEPHEAGDPFKVSDADTMLKHLNPKAKPTESVALLTKEGCGYCKKAKDFLKENSVTYEEISLSDKSNASAARILRAFSGKESTPVVFIGGRYVGGSEELLKHKF